MGSTDAPVPSPLAAVLAGIAEQFGRAAAGGPLAVPDAVAGIRALADAAQYVNGYPEPEHAGAVIRALYGAMPAVAQAAGDRVPHETVALGLAAAQNFASMFGLPYDQNLARTPPSLAADYRDHALLCADLLDAEYRRRTIEARGDPFRRSIVIRRADAENGDGFSRQ